MVYINRGEKEISSIQEFQKHFGFSADPNNIFGDEMDACLCGMDLDEIFKEKRIEYKTDCGDYYVGQLELVKGDND